MQSHRSGNTNIACPIVNCCTFYDMMIFYRFFHLHLPRHLDSRQEVPVERWNWRPRQVSLIKKNCNILIVIHHHACYYRLWNIQSYIILTIPGYSMASAPASVSSVSVAVTEWLFGGKRSGKMRFLFIRACDRKTRTDMVGVPGKSRHGGIDIWIRGSNVWTLIEVIWMIWAVYTVT
jgi:hypothetical protein